MSIAEFDEVISRMFAENAVPCDTLNVGPEGVKFCLAEVAAGRGSEIAQLVAAHVLNAQGTRIARLVAQLETLRDEITCIAHKCRHCSNARTVAELGKLTDEIDTVLGVGVGND